MDNAAIIKYFALNEHPFMTSPDPRFLYFSSQVKEALAKCEFMARDRIGPIYMYGPIGSGKTSLVRRLQEKLGQDERYNVKGTLFLRQPVNGCFHNTAALQFCKLQRRHLESEMYPRRIVRMHGAVYLRHKLT